MIQVQSHSTKLNENHDSFALFEALKQSYHDDQLFLLESLSGPNKDMNQAVIGFNPIFNIEFEHNTFKISGAPKLLEAIDHALSKNKSIQKLKPQQYQLQQTKDLWKILRFIESQFQLNYSGTPQNIRFGYFGYFGYDVIHAIEDISYQIEDDKKIPMVSLSIYQGIFNLDLQKQETFLTLNNSSLLDKIEHDQIQSMLDKKPDHNSLIEPQTVTTLIKNISDSITPKEYLKWVDKALYHIGIGDIYQIQLGHEITIQSDLHPYDMYKRLRELNPSPYMYYTQLSGQHIIGASPELFLRVEPNGKLTSRPIAGTIRRGKTEAENRQLQQQLLNDEKERAEHIMLIDLARNDIGRVCQKGTLEVDEHMVIEQYSHVSHIVSNVIGIKDNRYDKYDAIAATFPAGTMTGTPKVRAMEIIEDTETTRRGIYAGTIGFIGFNGVVETALCIRTAVYKAGSYHIRASGGIVYDSTPEGEWNETISKLSAPYFAITNKELRNESFIN